MKKFWQRRKIMNPKKTNIPRMASDVNLEIISAHLRDAHNEFTKTLEAYISDVQKINKECDK